MRRYLRSSPVHARRLRRLGLALAGLGVLLVLAAFGLAALRSQQQARREAERMTRFWLGLSAPSAAEPPFLTLDHQDLSYAPGQTALAFAAGFQPHEPLFVRLRHGGDLLDAVQARADARGQFVITRPLSLDELPAGSLSFQVEALSGATQEFAFRLEPGPPQEIAPTRGVFPAIAAPGSAVVLWCSHQIPGQAPIVQANVDGERIGASSLRLKSFPVASDGLLLAVLTVALDDPAGDWRVSLDGCEFAFPVRASLSRRVP